MRLAALVENRRRCADIVPSLIFGYFFANHSLMLLFEMISLLPGLGLHHVPEQKSHRFFLDRHLSLSSATESTFKSDVSKRWRFERTVERTCATTLAHRRIKSLQQYFPSLICCNSVPCSARFSSSNADPGETARGRPHESESHCCVRRRTLP